MFGTVGSEPFFGFAAGCSPGVGQSQRPHLGFEVPHNPIIVGMPALMLRLRLFETREPKSLKLCRMLTVSTDISCEM